MYSRIKGLAKQVREEQILKDNKIEREGFLDGNEGIIFFMSIVDRGQQTEIWLFISFYTG